jgi:alpha-N-arabinofuranosidase
MEMTAQLYGEVKNGARVGITAFYNSFFHYDIFVTKDEDGHKICLRKRVCDIDVVVASQKIEYNGKINLKIKSDRSDYTFLYENNGEFCELGRGKTALLTTEVTSPMSFTGTFFGVFAENGEISVSSVTLKEIK